MHTRPARTEPSTEPSAAIPPDLFLAEIEKAASRIGETTEHAGSWLARFAQVELTQLSEGQWTDLQYEISCLSEYQYGTRESPFLWRHALTYADWHGKERLTEDQSRQFFLQMFESAAEGATPGHLATVPALPTPAALPPRDHIKNLQGEVRQALDQLTEGHTLHVELPSVGLLIASLPETDETIPIGIAATPHHLFRYNLACILAAVAVRLRRCRECAQWFFAERKNRDYCSARCQSRHGTRLWRESLKTKSEQSKPTAAKAGRKKGGKHGTKR